MPHRTTLNQYAGFLSEGSGFKEDVIVHFLKEIGIEQLGVHQLQCAILFDEMSIKSGLVYSGHSHKIIGFVELGKINDEIEAFEKQVPVYNCTNYCLYGKHNRVKLENSTLWCNANTVLIEYIQLI